VRDKLGVLISTNGTPEFDLSAAPCRKGQRRSIEGRTDGRGWYCETFNEWHVSFMHEVERGSVHVSPLTRSAAAISTGMNKIAKYKHVASG
jgi:hypothetical protein